MYRSSLLVVATHRKMEVRAGSPVPGSRPTGQAVPGSGNPVRSAALAGTMGTSPSCGEGIGTGSGIRRLAVSEAAGGSKGHHWDHGALQHAEGT